jgi:2-dehydropantoate 2-reductase
MVFNEIIIYGAGSIGSVIGAILSQYNKVVLIGRKEHVDVINMHGLKISGDINKTFWVNAQISLKDISPKTLIIITTKAHDLKNACREINNIIKDDTVVLLLQNGLYNENIARKYFPNNVVLRGITNMAAELTEPGFVRWWKGEVIIEDSGVSREVKNVFERCGLVTKISNDILYDVWMKTVINCVINPLTAIFRVRNNEILEDNLRMIRHSIIKECVAVANADGVKLPSNLDEYVDKVIGRYVNYSSMCQDIMRGRKTEIDFLNGMIVELGKRYGIPTPVNEVLVNLIKYLEGRT